MMMKSILINGVWHDSANTMPVMNPFNNAPLAEVACATQEHAEQAITSAVAGFAESKQLSAAQRADILLSTAKLVQEQQHEFAESIVNETGKTIRAAQKEVLRAVNTLTLCAEEAKRLAGKMIPFDSVASEDTRVGYYTYEPMGVIVCITPFNDPLNLVAHKLGPAIAAGNSIILKPAEQAPLTALMLVKVLLQSGLPEKILNVLTGYGAEFGDFLVSHPDVAMVSFTGGCETGERIAKAAGAKKMLMELGANSPVIVMGDADIENAVEACVSGAYWASGHNCIGVQRIFIAESIYEQFRDQFVVKTNELLVGDPGDNKTDIGPMVDVKQSQRIEKMVQQTIEQGGDLLCGGQREGSMFQATVFDNPPLDAPVVENEVFAPVVSLFPFSDVEQVVKLANEPDYRIHGAVFTSDVNNAFSIAQALDMAGVMVNDSTDYRLDAMPFGGAGRGSIGREGVSFTIKEMSQTKVFCFKLAS